MKEIRMPRLGANDDRVLLALWTAEEGARVRRGELLAELESTKEAGKLLSPGEGILHRLAEEGEELRVGSPAALLLEPGETPPLRDPAPAGEAGAAEVPPPNLTRKALALARELGLPLASLPRDRMLREEDIRRLAGERSPLEAGPREGASPGPALSGEGAGEGPGGEPGEGCTQRLLVYGTGGWAREILEILSLTHAFRPEAVMGGVGDPEDRGSLSGVPILGRDRLEELFRRGCRKAANAVAVTPGAFSRREIYTALKKRGFEFPNLVHPRAVLDRDVLLGEGDLVFAGAFVGQEAVIGDDCVLNVGAVVSHQCVLGPHCHVASGAVLAGKVRLGENVLVGQGVTVYAGVRVGDGAVLQNGCHVYRDVPPGAVVRIRE